MPSYLPLTPSYTTGALILAPCRWLDARARPSLLDPKSNPNPKTLSQRFAPKSRISSLAKIHRVGIGPTAGKFPRALQPPIPPCGFSVWRVRESTEAQDRLGKFARGDGYTCGGARRVGGGLIQSFQVVIRHKPSRREGASSRSSETVERGLRSGLESFTR